VANVIQDFDAPLAAATRMVGYRRPWALAGGWGLDLWLGHVTRAHASIKIAILREHQTELREYLSEWSFKIVAVDGRMFPWKDATQMLMLPVHTLHATDRIGQTCVFTLHESDGIDWISRDNFAVRMNLSGFITHAHAHVPVLNPLLTLLGKSHLERDKDELDFGSVVSRLNDDQRTWLKFAVVRTTPWHAWVDRL